MLRTQNFWMHFPQGVLCKLLYFCYFRVFFRYFYFTLIFTIFITCLIYRKPMSIAFLSNVNGRFRWEHWKDQRQLSSVIYVLNEKWWILYSSLLLFFICVLSNFFKSTHWFSFYFSTWNSSLSIQKFIVWSFISICINI